MYYIIVVDSVLATKQNKIIIFCLLFIQNTCTCRFNLITNQLVISNYSFRILNAFVI